MNSGLSSASDAPTLSVGSLLSSFPDFILGLTFLATWIHPQWLGAGYVGRLMLVILVEFLTVHSAGLMGAVMTSALPKLKRVGALIALAVAYSMIAGAISVSVHAWWPLLGFWALTANRLLQVLFGKVPEGREKTLAIESWKTNGILYVFCVILASIVPLPALGVTPAVVAAQHFTSTGSWVAQPYRALAAGFAYYVGVGWSELTMEKRVT